MKKFRVQINAYQYHADFTVESEDSAEGIENAIIDRLGKSDIKWDESGFYDKRKKWITYEEVLDANTRKPLQTKEVLGVRLGTGAS